MKIYHNPRCKKSRETLALIEESGKAPQVVEYLKTPPTEEELKDILTKLGMKPADIIRKGEAIFKEQYKGKALSDEEWIRVLSENPKLIERPIVVEGDSAILGRPPENVKALL